MGLPEDLLEQAEHLARRDRLRPRQASLRRAVSTAYYALFHLLTTSAARSMASGKPGRSQIERAFKHAAMKKACQYFVSMTPPARIAKFLAGPVEPEIAMVARRFILLQEARHEADYDLQSTLSRSDTINIIQAAKMAFVDWDSVRRSPDAEAFLLCLFLEGR